MTLCIFQIYSLITSIMKILWLFVRKAAAMSLWPYDSNPYMSYLDEFIDFPFSYNCPVSVKSTSAPIPSHASFSKWLVQTLYFHSHIHIPVIYRLLCFRIFSSVPHPLFLACWNPHRALFKTFWPLKLCVLILDFSSTVVSCQPLFVTPTATMFQISCLLEGTYWWQFIEII